MTGMRRLELTYDVSNLSTIYEEKTVPWNDDDAEFTAGKDFKGTLRVWEDGVEPEQAWEAKKRLEGKAESFRVAMRYGLNHGVALKLRQWPTCYFNGKEYPLRIEQEFAVFIEYMRGKRDSYGAVFAVIPAATVRVTASASVVFPLPTSMPLIPASLHWMAETLVIAESLVGRPDEVMKHAFLILEEFKGARNIDRNEFQELEYVRDFVSHPKCYRKPSQVRFVSDRLPSAKVAPVNGKNCVQFSRNKPDHVAFVAKYADAALRRAKELFEKKVQAEGGFIGN